MDFRIVYDDDVYGARIIAEGPSAEGGEDYNVICNHLIGRVMEYWLVRDFYGFSERSPEVTDQ